jgi:hypothetical protein
MLAAVASLALPAWAAAPFTVNSSNGTVSDSSTSLVWDQCPLGLSTTTTACDTGTAKTYTWAAALTEAEARNAASYKGFNDWRVPNMNELGSIAKIDTYIPNQANIDASVFPNTPIGGDSLNHGGTWTSTTLASGPNLALVVYFDGGSGLGDNKTSVNYVRLVRSGQSLASFDALGASQSYTAATATGTGNETASFTGGGAGCAFGSAQFQAAPAAPPAGVTMPHGVFNFTTTNCGAGATLNFTITYPQPLPAGTQYYKYGPEFGGSAVPHWYVLPGAVVSGNQITFSITDNGLGDSNPAAGFITDPGGPGVPDAPAGGPGVPGGSGVTSVPTLSEWGVILLSLLMAAVGLVTSRRRVV